MKILGCRFKMHFQVLESLPSGSFGESPLLGTFEKLAKGSLGEKVVVIHSRLQGVAQSRPSFLYTAGWPTLYIPFL